MVPKTRIPTQVQDFTILPLHLPAQPAYPKETTHYLYLRPNAPRIPTETTPREVFLVNIPVDATEKNLRILFADRLGGGRIEDVEFEESGRIGKGIRKAPVVRGKKRKREASSLAENGLDAGEEVGHLPGIQDRPLHRSGSTAILRFVDTTSAQLALREAKKAAKTGRHILWTPAPDDAPLGEARYRAQHTLRYPDHAILQKSTDDYMSAFAAQEAEEARQLARKRAEPDEDGFVTVVRGGRNGPARPREDDTGAGAEGGDSAVGKKRKKHKGMVEEGFYRFQVREKKKREHGELAKRFEEDARKVEEMRRRRGKVRPE